jgi:hypothetical protein
LKDKLLSLIWGPRLFKDLLLLLALLPPVYLVYSVAFRLLPDHVWGSWLAFVIVLFLFVLLMFASWAFIRWRIGEKVPNSAWVQLTIAVFAFSFWVGLIPLELKLHTEFGTPMILPSYCDTDEAIGETSICRGRDFSAFGAKKAWYYGEVKPIKDLCTRYSEGYNLGQRLQDSCGLEKVSSWTLTPCSDYNVDENFVCLVCLEQPGASSIIRSLLAFNKDCDSGVFMYSINHELKGILN